LRHKVKEISINTKSLTLIVTSQYKIIEVLANQLCINPINFKNLSSTSSSKSSTKIKSDLQVLTSKLTILPPRPEEVILNTK